MKGLATAAVAATALSGCVAEEKLSSSFFDFEDGMNGWVQSKNERYQGSVWDVTSEGAGLEGDQAIQATVPHKFYGLTHVLDTPLGFDKDFVFQYEVRLTEGVTCSGSYVKLLSADPSFKAEELQEASPYSIMFGPDNCGGNSKVHLIFRQENPVTKTFEEKHMKVKVAARTDKFSHLYTLELRPDNTFTVKVDGAVEASGLLTSDESFEPSFNTPKEIDDPTDKKPEDWVDEEMMTDPEATKPEDWDEDAPVMIEDPNAVKPEGWSDDAPLTIPDPNAVIPESWDEEDDGIWEPPSIRNPACKVGCGEWKPPTIKNPAYKGKWTAPLIKNPDYKGPWAPRRIPNPGFFEEANPISTIQPIGAVAIEILANDKGVQFDSILIGHNISAATDYANSVFIAKSTGEKTYERESTFKDRHRKLKDQGPMAELMFHFNEYRAMFTEWAALNPKPVYGGIAGLVLLVTLLAVNCILSPSEDPIGERKKNDDLSNDESEDEVAEEETVEDQGEAAEEEEEEISDDEDEAENAGVRRRIPKAN